MEFIAAVWALKMAPDGWEGTLLSDNLFALRLVDGRTKPNPETLPPEYIEELAYQKARLGNIKTVLLDGHPTRAQLASGIGSRGNPVSKHNAWCDERCNALRDMYFAGTLTPEQLVRDDMVLSVGVGRMAVPEALRVPRQGAFQF
jgi:hypothetical protein